MKKIACFAFVFILTLSLASVSMAAAPTGTEIPCDPPMPSGEQVCVTAEYGPGDAQYQMMDDYLSKNGISYDSMTVLEVQVWDDHLEDWVPDSELGEGAWTLDFSGYPAAGLILHNSVMTGGTDQLPGGTSATVESFGLFALVYTSPSGGDASTAGAGAPAANNTLLWIVIAVIVAVAVILLVVLLRKKKQAK